MKKKLSKLQGFIRGEWNCPISCLNDSGFRAIKGDFRELTKNISRGCMPPDTLGARGFFFCCCLRRKLSSEAAIVTSGKKTLFFRSPRSRRSVCILIRACDHTCGSTTFFSKDFTQNILKINEAILVLRSLRYI